MSSVKDVIARRRSIRKFKKKEISNQLIREVIDAARLAPSGKNAQPSRFYIIRDEKTKEKLKNNKAFGQDFVYVAPVIIVCCGDTSVYPKEEEELEAGESNEIRANREVPIATQNLVLRATELGLGACYIGWMNKTVIKKVLGIDDRYVIPFAIILGYPDEKPKARPRKSLDEILLSEL